MNNFPAMTEEQRQELIADCENEIAELTQSIQRCDAIGTADYLMHLQSQLLRQQVALAALTAEPVGYVYMDENDCEFNGHNEFSQGKRGFAVYRAPSAPVLKPIELPGKGGVEATSERSIRDWSDGWAAYREEAVKAIRDAGYEVKS